MIELKRTTDVDLLMKWREEVLRCVFAVSPDKELMDANREYFRTHLADGSHIAYIARREGVDAGCGAVCLYDEMPSPDNRSGRCGYIMNMYVRPEFRHRGVATELLRRLVTDARENGCGKIYLETTEMGRSLYAELGFKEMKDMMKYGE